KLGDERAARGVDITLVMIADIGGRPGVKVALELAVSILEERPVEIALVAHGDQKVKARLSPQESALPASPLPLRCFNCLRSAASASPRTHDRRGRSPASSCKPPAPAPRRRSIHRRPSPIPGAACAW